MHQVLFAPRSLSGLSQFVPALLIHECSQSVANTYVVHRLVGSILQTMTNLVFLLHFPGHKDETEVLLFTDLATALLLRPFEGRRASF